MPTRLRRSFADYFFLDGLKVDAQIFGGIFALLTIGIIGGSQVNLLLSRRFATERTFQTALFGQCVVSVVFLAGTIAGAFVLAATLILFFALLSCIGILSPNATAVALAPFGKNVGSASALIGFPQIGIGALASSGVGLFNSSSSLPAITILAGMALLALLILTTGKRTIVHETKGEELKVAVAQAH
jgi:DHA1 family bicyclomycin/chloramphenicol resistance-like MFS transporter